MVSNLHMLLPFILILPTTLSLSRCQLFLQNIPYDQHPTISLIAHRHQNLDRTRRIPWLLCYLLLPALEMHSSVVLTRLDKMWVSGSLHLTVKCDRFTVVVAMETTWPWRQAEAKPVVTSDGKSRGWIWEHQESDFTLWQALFLEQPKILRAKFRLLGESKRLPGEKEKRKRDLVPVHLGPLGILTHWDVHFLLYRIGIILPDFSSLTGICGCFMKRFSEFLYRKMHQKYKLF